MEWHGDSETIMATYDVTTPLAIEGSGASVPEPNERQFNAGAGIYFSTPGVSDAEDIKYEGIGVGTIGQVDEGGGGGGGTNIRDVPLLVRDTP